MTHERVIVWAPLGTPVPLTDSFCPVRGNHQLCFSRVWLVSNTDHSGLPLPLLYTRCESCMLLHQIDQLIMLLEGGTMLPVNFSVSLRTTTLMGTKACSCIDHVI